MGTPGVYGAHWGTGQHLGWSFWSRWLLSRIASTSGLGKGQTGTNRVGRVQHLSLQCWSLIPDFMVSTWICLSVMSHMKFHPTWSSHSTTFLPEAASLWRAKGKYWTWKFMDSWISLLHALNEICSGPTFNLNIYTPVCPCSREASTALEGKAWPSLGDFWTTSPGDTGNMFSYFSNL